MSAFRVGIKIHGTCFGFGRCISGRWSLLLWLSACSIWRRQVRKRVKRAAVDGKETKGIQLLNACGISIIEVAFRRNRDIRDKALEMYNKSLKIRLAMLGEDHPDVATTYGCIGVYLKQGESNKGAGDVP